MELQQLIASPPCGAQWTASHQIAKKLKKSESGKRGAKARKAYVPGFSTGSETASDEDANPAAKQPAQAPPEATGRKKAGGNCSKEDVTTTKRRKQKVTATKQTKEKSTPKKSASKSKGGKSKSEKFQNIEDKGRKLSGQSERGKSDRGKVINVDKSDSDDDSLGFEDDEMAKVMEDVKKEEQSKEAGCDFGITRLCQCRHQ